MKTIPQKCQHCHREFDLLIKESKRGNGKFCSRKCARDALAIERKKKHSEMCIPNVCCAFCGVVFYATNKRIRASKHKVFFCCRHHKDLALRKESEVKLALPQHYKLDGFTEYREIYLRAKQIKACEKCGYDQIPEILEVHHKDRNRFNNTFENLLALCPNCHTIEHLHDRQSRLQSIRT